ncbi:MAG: hypothetical protein K8U57_12845 [Planctomycetes bacterium]|nr:hypothetical protein [Planctomycetota bacterium]
MTEADWETATDPNAMLQFLKGRTGDRKIRLIACGVARCVWDAMPADSSRRAVEVAEQFADRLATQEELHGAYRAAWDEAWDISWGEDASVPYAAAAAAEEFSVRAAENAVKSLGPQPIHCEVIRDIMGMQFTPRELKPAWRSAEVIALAQRIYEERRFPDMPRLGDALQQAGCQDATVLNHCRCSGLHARGCWVLDQVLQLGHGNEVVSEQQWLTCDKPFKLLDWLDYLQGKPPDRKIRLFNCSCVRRAWPMLTDERSRRALEVAERFCDGDADESELATAEAAARDFFLPVGEVLGRTAGNDPNHRRLVLQWKPGLVAATLAGGMFGMNNAAFHMRELMDEDLATGGNESAIQAAIFRDLIGNPFRSELLDPRWLTPTVLGLARTAYSEPVALDPRNPGYLTLDPSLLLILADALEEAGCDWPELLRHCRSGQPHWRGCWVVDCLLGIG